MPALAYGLGVAAGLNPALLAGLVLVGCINGGQASNLCTYIANGKPTVVCHNGQMITLLL
jgi:bile acid:Na+ symporter, BASS family